VRERGADREGGRQGERDRSWPYYRAMHRFQVETLYSKPSTVDPLQSTLNPQPHSLPLNPKPQFRIESSEF